MLKTTLSLNKSGFILIRCVSFYNSSNSNGIVNINTKVSTPIYYVNGEPHIGHIYSSSLADAISRWEQVKGYTTFLTTGTDEHGQKVKKEADNRKLKVEDYCDCVANSFKQELSHYNIHIDHFIRTTDPDHVEIVKAVWNKLLENGDLYEGTYHGYYCRSDEAFLTSSQVYEKDGVFFCKENDNVAEEIEECNWMFNIQKYKSRLLEFLKSNPNWITPVNFQRDIIRTVEDNTQDLSVSRPLSRVPWSIPTGDGNGVYVWIDALLNYITTNESKSFDKVIHIFGKDIVKFHGFYYPCLLMALGIPLPNHMICHNHWTVNGMKISKSKGNYVPLVELRKYIPGELLRGYLLTEDTISRDGDFSTSHLLSTINGMADLYGNLLLRSLGTSIAGPLLTDTNRLPNMEVSIESKKRLKSLVDSVSAQYDSYSFSGGYNLIMKEIRDMNAFFDENHPWTVTKAIKSGQTCLLPQLLIILNEVWESLRICSILLQPIIPSYSEKVLQVLLPTSKRENLFRLSSIQHDHVDIETLRCTSEKLFEKLSKEDERKFLKL